MNSQKKKIIAIIIGSVMLIIGLLVYYQNQGLIKVFPTALERQMKVALKYDEDNFLIPEGLPLEDFEKQIQAMKKQRENVKNNQQDATEWFTYGYLLNNLNDHEDAVKAWEISYELSQTFQTAGNIASISQYFLQDYEKAERYYFEALRLAEGYGKAYSGLMTLYRFHQPEKRHQYEPIVLRAIDKDKASLAYYFSNLAEFFSEADRGIYNPQKAKMYFERLREVDEKIALELAEYYPDLLKD